MIAIIKLFIPKRIAKLIEDRKTNECRIAAIKWIICLVWSIPFILTLMFYERLFRTLLGRIWKQEIVQPLPKNEQKTVLITGGPLTKGNFKKIYSNFDV